MLTREKIIDEIKRTATQNGGKPLGINRFFEETGIKPYDWKKYWARFGDAQIEAGFTANQLNSSLDDEFVFEKMIGLIRKLGKFPALGELRIEKGIDPEFPNTKTLFETKEQKRELASRLIEWCQQRTKHDDVIKICSVVIDEPQKMKESTVDTETQVGEVYLFRSGRYYKIGKTNDTVRRGSELRIQLPEKMELIHSIKTDDPSGVELYWHRRLEAKRMNGEWFDLAPSDVKTFKRWKRIF